MKKDGRSRKYQLTINNPKRHGLDHEFIKSKLSEFPSMVYWCMCDEVGENKTYHTHVYMALNNATRFSTIKKKLPSVHIEMANGTSQQNRDYIRKEGKWESSKKKETNLIDTFEEWGSMPIERQGQRNDLHDLYDMIKQGMSNAEIMEENPEHMMKLDKIERARQTIRNEKYKDTFRDVKTVYIYGETGTGKTRGVMEEYGYSKVYRVTDYEHPFDSYKGEDVIIFEEFRSSLRVQDMLNYLDGYPLELPCRYLNKQACYTKVYMISNIKLEQQYQSIQEDHPETWNAFMRRIDAIKKYSSTGIDEYDVKGYFADPLVNAEQIENEAVQGIFRIS